MSTPDPQLVEAFSRVIHYIVSQSALTAAEIKNVENSASRVAKGFMEMVMPKDQLVAELQKIWVSKFPRDGNEDVPIIEGPIFTSGLCPHHLLPIVNKVWYGYLASRNQDVLGLSKFVRIAQLMARRATIQEQYTVELAKLLSTGRILTKLGDDGFIEIGEPISPSTAVYVEAEHMCMACRGVRSQSHTHTSYFTGAFMEPLYQNIFWNMVKK